MLRGNTFADRSLTDGDMIQIIEDFFYREPFRKWVKEVKYWKRTGRFVDYKDIPDEYK
jgi:hypothetical protein